MSEFPNTTDVSVMGPRGPEITLFCSHNQITIPQTVLKGYKIALKLFNKHWKKEPSKTDIKVANAVRPIKIMKDLHAAYKNKAILTLGFILSNDLLEWSDFMLMV